MRFAYYYYYWNVVVVVVVFCVAGLLVVPRAHCSLF